LLWIAVALVSTVLACAYATRLELRRAHYPLHEMQALGIAAAGVQCVIAELQQENNDFIALSQPWKRAAGAYAQSLETAGTLVISVEDEDGKLNLSSAGDELLNRLLMMLNYANRGQFIDSLRDWQDADTVLRPSGAEELYYQACEPPRHCKDAPLDSVEELALIRGNDGQNMPGAILNTVTVYSGGKININTASTDVLAALLEGNYPLAQAVIAARSGPDGIDGTADDTPFKKEDMLKSLAGGELFGRIASQITVRSSFFKVRSVGNTGGAAKTVEAMLEKIGSVIHIRYWREL